MSPTLWVLLGANVVAFLAYAWDKCAAIRGWRRVPEKRLLLASTPLTAPGAWAAVLLLRHKSSKAKFLIPLCGLTVAQGVVAGWIAAKTWN